MINNINSQIKLKNMPCFLLSHSTLQEDSFKKAPPPS